VNFSWESQPVLKGSQRAEFYWEGERGTGAKLASALRGWEHLGNVVTADARLRYAMEVAGANAIELHRELRLALGQAWDDELEVFRHAGQDSAVVWLHKVG